MATYSATPQKQQRPAKKVVRYGKASIRTYSNTHAESLFDDDDDEDGSHLPQASAPARSMSQRKPSTVKSSFPVDKLEPKKAALKQVKPQTKKLDAFDVPSSDEETEAPRLKRLSSLSFKAPLALVDDTPSTSELAPWEKRKNPNLQLRAASSPRSRKVEPFAPAAQLQSELAQEVSRLQKLTSPRASSENVVIPEPSEDPKLSSAAARLAARRKQQGEAPSKPSAPSSKCSSFDKEVVTPIQRKRARTDSGKGNSEDVTADALVNYDNDVDMVDTQTDIFDVPESDSNERRMMSHVKRSPKPFPRNVRRGRAAPKRNTPKKGVSAPARLANMLPMSSGVTDEISRSPSTLESRLSTPIAKQQYSSDSPKPAGSLTPKQVRAWDRILPSEEPRASSPGALLTKSLGIDGRAQRRSQAKASALTRTLQISSSDSTDVPKKTTKLVDRLKAAASSSSSELESDSADSDEGMEDVKQDDWMGSQVSNATLSAQTSQSQSQSQSNVAEDGPKITYARVRSYLPDDSLEDGMLLDLPSISPPRQPAVLRRTGTANGAPQKSAFDLEDSDEDMGLGRLRNIHELRAAGKAKTFMEGTEASLEDIANHTSTARGARRNALMDIAKKMTEKGYVERFIAHGFEQQIAAEFSAPPDEAGEFLLAAVTALLLIGEPPQHTLTCLRDAGILPWLLRQLVKDVEVRKLARDRKSNMSKSAQSSFLGFVDTFKAHTSLWEHAQPSIVTPRLAALKALELYIGRSRRVGDKSELLTAEQLPLVLAHHCNPAQPTSEKTFSSASPANDEADVSLSISVLELLAIVTLPLAWPDTVTRGLAATLPALAAIDGMPRHTTFLGLRLTLNLTNENVRNCAAFAQADSVQYLLCSAQEAFAQLDSSAADEEGEEQQRELNRDLLMLSMCIAGNIFDQNEQARDLAIEGEEIQAVVDSLMETFKQGQESALEADRMEDMSTNIAFGYLAVMLANLCQSEPARSFVMARLPGKALSMLVDAVEQFTMMHEKADKLQRMEGFEGEEGGEVWGGFTAKLKAVLMKLKAVA